MRKSRFTNEQIIEFLREAETGVSVRELCSRHGFSDAMFYIWRQRFGCDLASEARRLKMLQQENAKLKKLLANAMLDIDMLRGALRCQV